MKIEKNKVVSVSYTLSALGGEVLESAADTKPMTYLHGYNNILLALESRLEGKSVADELDIDISPEHAYGLRNEDAQQRVPIKHLLTKKKLRPGMLVKVNTEQGPKDAKVIKVGRFNVDVDMNHPLAGMSLNFKIKIEAIRDADPEEITHGHAHGSDGHQH